MKSITHKDILIILSGAIQMSEKDLKVVEEEKGLLKKMMEASGIDSKGLKEFKDAANTNIKELSNQLSSDTAKKLFLLTLAAVAQADQVIDKNEKEMLDDLTKELKVGQINIGKIACEDCEEMVLKMLSENK